ncbi:MAG: polysaccharide deacetylase family protein [Bacteroidales bacterium]|nr:polysaccharide deacetylase family protein [Bacteroidales bacterium]MCF8402558.1 polysaccharide deacetylase family protein [Bacteroidales bacterium]
MQNRGKKYCLITNDVETTSLWNHCLSDQTGEKVLKEGMPVLLELYRKYNIKATFYFTGHIAKLYPDVVRMIIPDGHEVGCHGLTHESDKAFDKLSYRDQVDHLIRSKGILESISNTKVVSFRAPALRVNEDTPKALAETGFLIDSSVAPQRMDMFLSFGSVNKLKWFTAPRNHYFTKENNLARRGNGNIFEIPILAAGLPYTGTMMRISPSITHIVKHMLVWETSVLKRPLVFLIHPNELIEEEIIGGRIQRRANNYFAYLLGDKLRYYIKLRNLGKKAIPLFESHLSYLSKKNYCFVTAKDYYELNKTKSNETISQES